MEVFCAQMLGTVPVPHEGVLIIILLLISVTPLAAKHLNIQLRY